MTSPAPNPYPRRTRVTSDDVLVLSILFGMLVFGANYYFGCVRCIRCWTRKERWMGYFSDINYCPNCLNNQNPENDG